MRTDDFDFDLPPGLIAQQPADPRDSSRLMHLPPGGPPAHHHFRDLPALLRRGDLLVLNDTRVMAARLRGTRTDTGGAVEALLLRPFTDTRWEVMMRPAKQAVPGRRFTFETTAGPIKATAAGRDDDIAILDFDHAPDPATAGTVPLPPYITEYEGDAARYQTVFAREARSAAAPTAGLHFTDGLFARLEAAGISRTTITLEVGPGTFQPVRADDPRDHKLHHERFSVSEAAAAAITGARAAGRRVVAVGTTSVRVLEHLAATGGVRPETGETGIAIYPGHTFGAVDAIITNFHLPRSTLLMLVSAFAGQQRMLAAYGEAVARGYRFYSFGDAMLLESPSPASA